MDPEAFQAQEPYPWANPEGLLTDEGFECLRETLPEPALFEKRFGVQRKHGQHPHDRYALEYREDLGLAPPWRDFVAEVMSERYRRYNNSPKGRARDQRRNRTRKRQDWKRDYQQAKREQAARAAILKTAGL